MRMRCPRNRVNFKLARLLGAGQRQVSRSHAHSLRHANAPVPDQFTASSLDSRPNCRLFPYRTSGLNFHRNKVSLKPAEAQTRFAGVTSTLASTDVLSACSTFTPGKTSQHISPANPSYPTSGGGHSMTQLDNSAQFVELILVLQPFMTDASGTNEAPMLMTLLRTVTPTNTPE